MTFIPRTLQKMAILVRTDLGMSEGKIASQCAHAALECYLKHNKGIVNGMSAKLWLMTGQPKVVLKVGTEQELIALGTEAANAGLTTAAIRDAGKTQVKAGTITVLGIGPGHADRVDSIVQDLKLL